MRRNRKSIQSKRLVDLDCKYRKLKRLLLKKKLVVRTSKKKLEDFEEIFTQLWIEIKTSLSL